MRNKYDIYLAGPFFTDIERNENNEILKILKEKGLRVFVPKEHTIKNGDSLNAAEWSEKVAEMDIKALNQSSILVMQYNGLYSDSGTAWENGYAFAKGIPTVVVHMNRDIFPSLMITSTAQANILSLEELKEYDFKKLDYIPYIGNTK